MSENLYDLLSRRFTADRSKPCFLLSDGRAISYGDLEAGAAQVAGRLAAEGVRAGDRVALQAEKSAEVIMIYLGVLKAGAVFLPLNNAYTPAEVDYFLGDAEPKVFVTDPPAWVAEAAAYAPMLASAPRSADDLASLIYTSGTTGRSKGRCSVTGTWRRTPWRCMRRGGSRRTTCCCTPYRSSTCMGCSWRCTARC